MPATDAAEVSESATRTRVLVFCAVAFALAGTTAIVLAATGGLADSRVLVPGTPVTVALVLLPTAYMFSPALAHVATRLITREGWSGTGLRPRWRAGRWRFWLLAYVLPPLLTVVGAAVYFAVLPGALDAGMTTARGQIADAAQQAGEPLPISAAALIALQVALALTIAPFVNAVVALGEELGWRGYLQPRLVELLGTRRGVVLTGVVWGAWHWPLILMGYEYGLDAPGAPWLGPVVFLVFAVSAGTVLGWLTVRGGSVWPAVLAHASINATATLPILVTAGEPELLVGPLPIGVVGAAGWLAAAALLLWRWPGGGAAAAADGADVGATGARRSRTFLP